METPEALLVALERAHGWKPVKARRWLGFLAHHLEATGRRELAWWRLPDAVQRGRWAATMSDPPGDNRRPCQLDLRLRGRVRPLMRALRVSFAGVVVAVLPVVVLEIVQALAPELGGENAGKVPGAVGVLGVIVGVAIVAVGVVLGVYWWSQVPQPAPTPYSPAESLRRDLRMSKAQWLIFGGVLGVVGGLAAGVAAAVDEGEPALLPAVLVFVAPIGFTVGVLFGVMLFLFGVTASGRYLAAVQHLALRRRVPWRLMRFLDDACDVGLLRRSGAAFEFGDTRLRHHFAASWAGSAIDDAGAGAGRALPGA